MVLPVYMLFVLGSAVAAFFVLRASERREHPSVKLVTCPETNVGELVEVDRRHQLLTLARGIKETRLKSCSRWPARADCGQECLAQIEPSSQVERILERWYDAQKCGICSRPLTRYDWHRGRAAAIDSAGQLVELREMDWTRFPNVLSHYAPLCWNCHETELVRVRASRVAAAC